MDRHHHTHRLCRRCDCRDHEAETQRKVLVWETDHYDLGDEHIFAVGLVGLVVLPHVWVEGTGGEAAGGQWGYEWGFEWT